MNESFLGWNGVNSTPKYEKPDESKREEINYIAFPDGEPDLTMYAKTKEELIKEVQEGMEDGYIDNIMEVRVFKVLEEKKLSMNIEIE